MKQPGDLVKLKAHDWKMLHAIEPGIGDPSDPGIGHRATSVIVATTFIAGSNSNVLWLLILSSQGFGWIQEPYVELIAASPSQRSSH